MGPPVVNYYESVAVCLRVFLKQVKPNQPTMSVDAAEIKRICDIYDWHGKGELDMYYFMDIFYALGMNLTKKTTSSTVKPTMSRRSSANSTKSSPLSNKPSRSPNTLATTMTTLSCANCTTKMRTEP